MKIKKIGTIQDIQGRTDLTLITGDFETSQTFRHLGGDQGLRIQEEYGLYGLFASVEDGDYSTVYAFNGSVPFLWKDLYEVLD
jgi:hypothetical protein